MNDFQEWEEEELDPFTYPSRKPMTNKEKWSYAFWWVVAFIGAFFLGFFGYKLYKLFF